MLRVTGSTIKGVSPGGATSARTKSAKRDGRRLVCCDAVEIATGSIRRRGFTLNVSNTGGRCSPKFKKGSSYSAIWGSTPLV